MVVLFSLPEPLWQVLIKRRRGGWGGGASLVAQWDRIHLPMQFDPWSRKIPQATEQLSLSTTTTEPVL